MSQYSYVPGDQRLVDHIIGELKSKGIFDQFRKECIADVDTRPAYQNLRLRVEGSVSGYLSHQRWRPDLNKNGLREKLRKHIHEANYLEQGVERIVDQVVNPKVQTVFIPQVEELVYSYLGIERPKSTANSNNIYPNSSTYVNPDSLLPTDLEAVSPDSVKSQDVDQKEVKMDASESEVLKDIAQIEADSIEMKQEKNKDLESPVFEPIIKEKSEPTQDTQLSGISDLTSHESNDSNSKAVFIPQNDTKLEEPKAENTDVNQFTSQLVRGTSISNLSMDIPLPDEPPKIDLILEESIQTEFKPSSDAESSSDSTMMRNVSPLTPIRSFNNENSCDAQPSFDERQDALENVDEFKNVIDIPIPISTFRFAIESKDSSDSNDVPTVDSKTNKPLTGDKSTLSYQFESQINLNNYGGPSYDDSSCSNNLHIDYQSDHNGATADSKNEQGMKTDSGNMLNIDEQSKSKDHSFDEKRGSHKSSRSSRDSRRHSSSKHSKNRRSESKQHASSGDKKGLHTSDKKSSKDESSNNSKSRHCSQREKSKERSEKKDKDRTESNKEKHSSSHKSSTSSHRESKSKHHSSSSSRRHSSTSGSKNIDEKKSSSSSREKYDDKKDDSKDHRTHSKSSSHDNSRQSSSHRSDKDKSKNSSKDRLDKNVKKHQKKDKKVIDDHYSASGRGSRVRRSTDRDSNDGNSSSSKGSTFVSTTKTTDNTGGEKSSSKSENNSSGCDSNGQSDTIEQTYTECNDSKESEDNVDASKCTLKPVIMLDSHLNTPIIEAPQLPPVQTTSIKKPMIAANMNEAIKLMKIRRSMAAEQEKKRQEAALLNELKKKIESNVSQVFSGVSGPELEFACQSTGNGPTVTDVIVEIENNVEAELKHGEINGHAADVDLNINEITVLTKREESKTINLLKDKMLIADQQSSSEKEKNDDYVVKTTDKTNIVQDEDERDDFLDFLCGDPNKEMDLKFFGQQEIYNAELARDKFSKFYGSLDQVNTKKKIFLLNCDASEVDIFNEIYKEMGTYTVVNFCQKQKKPELRKSGLNKLNTQDLAMSKELNLPIDTKNTYQCSNMSPSDVHQKYKNSSSEFTYTYNPNLSSDCSLDSSADYEQKIDEMMNKTSHQEIMEIIFGGIPTDSPSKMPKVVFSDSRDDGEPLRKPNLKRKRNGLKSDVDGTENNNHTVLMPNKIRKLSISDQITSTTEAVSMSPSSDKSVENYEQSSPVKRTSPKLNGTVAKTQDRSVACNKPVRKHKLQQRYDTSDLYKPKLLYLSKRHSHVPSSM